MIPVTKAAHLPGLNRSVRSTTVGEIILIASALIVGIIALAASPWMRAICWDSLVHPRYHCLWEKRGSKITELKACIDKAKEN
jgi:hypothetical protein